MLLEKLIYKLLNFLLGVGMVWLWVWILTPDLESNVVWLIAACYGGLSADISWVEEKMEGN